MIGFAKVIRFFVYSKCVGRNFICAGGLNIPSIQIKAVYLQIANQHLQFAISMAIYYV